MKVEFNGKIITLQVGDRVITPITPLSISKHHSIFIGSYLGEPHFIENKIGLGVRLISAKNFFRENKVISRIDYFKGNNYQRNEIIENAFKLLGGRYDLLLYNCEHFANEVLYKKAFSNQIKIGILFGLGLLIIHSVAND